MAGRPTLIAVGNSHLAAVLSAFEAWAEPTLSVVPVSLWDPALQPAWTVAKGVVTYGTAFTAELQEAGRTHPGADAICCWGSNAHFSTALMPKGPPFDFVLPWMPDLPPDPARNLVPYDMVREHVANSIRPYAGLLRATRDALSGPVWSVPPPPPLADTARVHALVADTLEPKLARQVRADRIASPSVRLKLWYLAVEAMRAMTAEIGAHFLEPPPLALDEAGFLRSDLAADALHANATFGRMLIDHLAATNAAHQDH